MRPSDADRAITKKIVTTLDAISIHVVDHMIVAGDKYFSFAEKVSGSGDVRFLKRASYCSDDLLEKVYYRNGENTLNTPMDSYSGEVKGNDDPESGELPI